MMILVVTMLFHTYLNVLVRSAKKTKEREDKKVKVGGFQIPTRPKSAPTPQNRAKDKIEEKSSSKVLPDKNAMDNHDGLSKARYFNCLAQIVFALAVFIFMVIFWSFALTEYLRDPESFLQGKLY